MTNHSQQQNTTSSFAWFSASECIAWLTVFGMEAAAIVTLNALTISVYLKKRTVRKCSMYLVINLAVADIFVAGAVIVECWLFGGDCNFWTVNLSRNTFRFSMVFVTWFFAAASLINLGLVSLERTHATFRPFKHRLIKKRIFGAAAAIVWITAGLFSTSIVLILVLQPLNLESLTIFNISYCSFFLFCHLIIVASYSSVATKIVCGTKPHYHSTSSRDRKLTKTLFIVTAVSLLLTLPITVFMILEHASSTLTTISPRTYYCLNYSFLFLFYLNSLVNPVLYTFRMPGFRRALLSFLHCRSQPDPALVYPLNEM